tara:strand:- start:2920 stop:3690 length:771 start_codon:yes stop_codon:yes gene_type:complete
MSTLKVEEIQHPSNSNNAVSIASDSSVSLKHSGSAKLATTSTGVSVTGTCTATEFSGSAASLTALPAANLTGTLPAISGANLTSLPAANLTGALPAIDGSNLTGVGGGAAPPCWYGEQDAVTTIYSSSWTSLTNFATSPVNPSGNSSGWDESTGLFTAQSGQAGIYYVFGSVGIDDIQENDLIRLGVAHNNTNPTYYSEYIARNTGNNHIFMVQISKVLTLAVGDTVRLQAYHDEGSSQETETKYTWFGGFRLVAT